MPPPARPWSWRPRSRSPPLCRWRPRCRWRPGRSSGPPSRSRPPRRLLGRRRSWWSWSRRRGGSRGCWSAATSASASPSASPWPVVCGSSGWPPRRHRLRGAGRRWRRRPPSRGALSNSGERSRTWVFRFEWGARISCGLGGGPHAEGRWPRRVVRGAMRVRVEGRWSWPGEGHEFGERRRGAPRGVLWYTRAGGNHCLKFYHEIYLTICDIFISRQTTIGGHGTYALAEYLEGNMILD